MFRRRAGALTLLILMVLAEVGAAARPNVLFIAVDDLRPQLACFGQTQMHSPNIDQLAARGVLFERAYCMVPTCGASRASLMSGVRPARHRFVSYTARVDKDAPGTLTLNTHFKNQGYHTVSLGKVFHFPADQVDGWSERPWRPSGSDYQDAQANRAAIQAHRKKYPQRKTIRGVPFEAADVPESQYRDYQNASKAIEYLDRFAQDSSQPFFLAVGFFKPHLPFCAPKKYWDLYDSSTIDIPDNYHAPKDAPPGAVHTSGELRAYAGIPPTGPVDRLTARKLIHGYYACVSFTDAQVGRVLAELRRLKLDQNTIVVLWGDHGWQLGEHGMWNKHSCFETSMHAPLLVAAPMRSEVKPGTRVAALTEFIDIYPSLCDLCDLPVPDHLQGASFVPLMENPKLTGKPYAIGRFQSGDTIRSDLYRFSEYTNGKGKLLGRMLYDHGTDSDENYNVVKDHSEDADQLTRILRRDKGKD